MKNKSGVSLITLIITIIVVIILAVIVLRSGASDAPDQAAFSKFTTQMGELQDAVKVAMLEAKADELLDGNQRTEAQLYNFIARGGYEGFKYEREESALAPGKGIPDEAKWLTLDDAEKMRATLIYKNKGKETIGQDLPVIKVETAYGVNQELSYFVTNKGTVFCWPPYVYDGKCYVNANANTRVTDFDGNEIKEALDIKPRSNYRIEFENEQIINVEHEDDSSFNGPIFLEKGLDDIFEKIFVFYHSPVILSIARFMVYNSFVHVFNVIFCFFCLILL